MDEHEVRLKALEIAREALGKDAKLEELIDYAWKVSQFLFEGYTSKTITNEFNDD